MARSLIPLDVISSDICSDIGDSMFKHKFKITRHLMSAYRKLNMFLPDSFDVRTEILDYGNQMECPCDFIFETKVGLKVGDRVVVLHISDDRIEPVKLGDTEVRDWMHRAWNGEAEGSPYYFYNTHYRGGYLGEMYGIGRSVSNSGLYSIDRKAGTITVGGNIPKGAQLVLEYKSDGSSDGMKLVPSEWKEALEFYAKHRFYADRNITQSQINLNYYKRESNQIQRLYSFRDALYMADTVQGMFSPSNY